MISRRTIVIGILFLFPVLVYLGFGAYALWQTGLFRWTWWIIPGCWLAVFLTGKFWKKPDLSDRELPTSVHWTPQDDKAKQIIRQFQQRVDTLEPEDLTGLQLYVDTAQELARALANHYHQDTKDAISSLTVVEVLAAIRLAVDDLEDWFQDSVPGGHLITIHQWKMLSHAPKWVQRASDAGWLASVLWNPLNAARFLTSKMTLAPVTDQLKTEVLAAVYLRFLRNLGFYLIEMNSGRLRRGAKRYRATFGSGKRDESDRAQLPIAMESVSIALIGQVKAGKSSVTNALIGSRAAQMDVLPATRQVSRYRLNVPDSAESVVLLDTPGYADAGATAAELKDLEQAIQAADVFILVVDAHSPAKAADKKVLDQINKIQRQNPQFKPPPLIICLTHIDLLSPMMEWNPPYNWVQPQSDKEQSIHDAIAASREIFGSDTGIFVPVCADIERERAFNITPGLMTAIVSQLDEGQAVSLLRAYETGLDNDRWKKLLGQLKKSGTTMLNLWVEERLKRAD